jgi:peptidyl-prolyl cis-trans isomerase C
MEELQGMKTKIWKTTVALSASCACILAVFASDGPVREASVPSVAAPVASPWDFVPETVAVFGDRTITRDDFIREISENVPDGLDEMPPEILRSLAGQIAITMVNERILLTAAEKDGIVPSPELVKEEFERFQKDLTQDERKTFSEMLERQNSNLDAYRGRLMNNRAAQEGLAIHRWVEARFGKNVSVTPEEVKHFYDKNREQFEYLVMPASHVLVKTDENLLADPKSRDGEMKRAKAKIDALLARIRAGEDFAVIAKSESDCPSGSEKGVLGEIRQGELDLSLDEALFALKSGEMTEPIASPAGYHLLKANGPATSKCEPIEKVESFIRQSIRAEKMNRELDAFLAKERERLGAKIMIDVGNPPTAKP